MPKTSTANRRAKSPSRSNPKTQKTKIAKVQKAQKARGVEKLRTPADEVAVDRRRNERRAAPAEEIAKSVPVVAEAPQPPKPSERRAKVPRRRQIDPTTCERDYSDEEIEFMHALDNYKRANGRMFPTCSEILEVVRALGYTKLISTVSESLASATQQAGTSTEDEFDSSDM